MSGRRWLFGALGAAFALGGCSSGGGTGGAGGTTVTGSGGQGGGGGATASTTTTASGTTTTSSSSTTSTTSTTTSTTTTTTTAGASKFPLCADGTSSAKQCKDCCDCDPQLTCDQKKACRDECNALGDAHFAANPNPQPVNAPSVLGKDGDYGTCTTLGTEQECKQCCDCSTTYACGDLQFCRTQCSAVLGDGGAPPPPPDGGKPPHDGGAPPPPDGG